MLHTFVVTCYNVPGRGRGGFSNITGRGSMRYITGGGSIRCRPRSVIGQISNDHMKSVRVVGSYLMWWGYFSQLERYFETLTWVLQTTVAVG